MHQKVLSRYSRRSIWRHLLHNHAPLPFGLHFWISPGVSESAFSILQKDHLETLGQESGTTPFAITNSSVQVIVNDHEALRRNLPYLLYHRSTSTRLPGCFVVINYHLNVWISPGASESHPSILQKVHWEPLAPESSTIPFWTPFLDLAR